MAQRDLITRLADRGEEMLAKFAETPGAHRVLELMNTTRERLDDLQKRVIGLENLERRLDDVEKRLAKIEKSATAPARKPATTRAKAPAKKTPAKPAPKKPAA